MFSFDSAGSTDVSDPEVSGSTITATYPLETLGGAQEPFNWLGATEYGVSAPFVQDNCPDGGSIDNPPAGFPG